MRILRRSVAGLAVVLCLVGQVAAQELLTSGDFEPPNIKIPGWDLDEFVTGNGTPVNAAELTFFDPNSGDRALWLRSFEGGEEPGPNNLTNAILSQTVSGTAGENYTFSGWSRWETNYSGGVTTLDPSSPLGAVPSPTQTTMELAFLDSSNNLLGTPIELDLRTEQANINFWMQHTLVGTAPTGTSNVRVTAAARDMVWNIDPNQTAFFDDFSLTNASDPGNQMLTNHDLEALPPSGLDAWTVFMDDPANPENDEIIRAIGFANRPDSGGSTGVWLSSFFGDEENPVTGILSQTVAGVEGGNYLFTGWSLWEANYAGGLPGFPTQTLMGLEFLDGDEEIIGAPIVLDLSTEQMNDSTWRQHAVNGIAPAGTEFVRVVASMIDGVNSDANPQSAFFDDFSLVLLTNGLDGDFNGDGIVDGHDLLAWQRGESPNPLSPGDLATWENNFGTSSLVAAQSIPEPATGLLLLTIAVALASCRGRLA